MTKTTAIKVAEMNIENMRECVKRFQALLEDIDTARGLEAAHIFDELDLAIRDMAQAAEKWEEAEYEAYEEKEL